MIFISTRHQHLLHSVVTLATKPSQNKYRGNSKTKREYQLPGVIRVEIFFFVLRSIRAIQLRTVATVLVLYSN